jgi:prevent-host-death family protein
MQIPAGEFKAKCLKLMDQVARSGVPIVITKHGKPVAKLVPPRQRRVPHSLAISRAAGRFGAISSTFRKSSGPF